MTYDGPSAWAVQVAGETGAYATSYLTHSFWRCWRRYHDTNDAPRKRMLRITPEGVRVLMKEAA